MIVGNVLACTSEMKPFSSFSAQKYTSANGQAHIHTYPHSDGKKDKVTTATTVVLLIRPIQSCVKYTSSDNE